MKASDNVRWAGISFLALIVFWAVYECLLVVSWGRNGANVGESYAYDLTARRNEILCAHQGVNSFRIWNREKTLSGFHPHNRPDKPNVAVKPGDRNVHAYPAWHTAYFYFYGWLPERVFYSVLGCLFGLCMMSVIYGIRDVCGEISDYPWLLTLGVLSLVAPYVFECFVAQNYGMLILALMFLMVRALSVNCQVLAGLCWALAMIKPQMAALLFWPLLFGRKYVAIVTAALVCVGATMVTGYIVAESPVDLILQVPQIGTPYTATHFFNRIFGPCFNWAQMLVFGSLCGFLCYKMRDDDKWYCRYAPVALCTPLWTYNQPYDNMIFIIWYCAVVHELFSETDIGAKKWKIYVAVCFSAGLLTLAKDFAVLSGLNSIVLIWVGRAVRVAWWLASFAMLLHLVKVRCVHVGKQGTSFAAER